MRLEIVLLGGGLPCGSRLVDKLDFVVPSRRDSCMSMYPDMRLRRADMHVCLCVLSARERNERRSLFYQLYAPILPTRQLPMLHEAILGHTGAIDAHKPLSGDKSRVGSLSLSNSILVLPTNVAIALPPQETASILVDPGKSALPGAETRSRICCRRANSHTASAVISQRFFGLPELIIT